jgi:hypothetical protein
MRYIQGYNIIRYWRNREADMKEFKENADARGKRKA